ncbi:MAG: hypothetical protein CVV49_00495 [Spirochaetae bacterium HGW-Spirochaetae-5]|nr:MAG: hypothetical protein CVV49_00495 [Spirochaetae bacterium HGW-Spirochaetae-5]
MKIEKIIIRRGKGDFLRIPGVCLMSKVRFDDQGLPFREYHIDPAQIETIIEGYEKHAKYLNDYIKKLSRMLEEKRPDQSEMKNQIETGNRFGGGYGD